VQHQVGLCVCLYARLRPMAHTTQVQQSGRVCPWLPHSPVPLCCAPDSAAPAHPHTQPAVSGGPHAGQPVC
jgi:hypothetical protein